MNFAFINQQWFFENIAWDILSKFFSLFVIGVLGKAILDTIQAFRISKKILKNNRPNKGHGYGTQAADIFLEVWLKGFVENNKESKQSISHGSQVNIRSRFYKDINDKYLKPLNLTFSEYNNIYPKINFRNKIVAYIVKNRLISMGDDPKYYKKT